MKICIIGGGIAGWWCAAYMEKFLDAEITLIESDEIPISGVGEGTLPQVGHFFDHDFFETSSHGAIGWPLAQYEDRQGCRIRVAPWPNRARP